MTAEIAILNKHAIALAADSAATSGNKIFQSANKIFALSKYNPVGIMLYSSALYCGIPWETIIKEYRHTHPNIKFKKLKSYALHFFKFIKKSKSINANKMTDKKFIYLYAFQVAENMQNDIHAIVQNLTNKTGKTNIIILASSISKYFEDTFKKIKDSEPLSIRKNINKDRFIKNFDTTLNDIYRNSKLNKYEEFVENLEYNFYEAIYYLVTSPNFLLGFTGVVFTGFGEQDIYPKLYDYTVGYSFMKNIQIIMNAEYHINERNTATVIPFAQGDIIGLFMDGIHQNLNEDIINIYISIINEYREILTNSYKVSKKKILSNADTINKINIEIARKLKKEINDMKRTFWRPTIDTIGIMQPIEIAHLADSLVSITSVHRKVALPRETVGGPTDVALISKGDGFIWIKRKHYFDAALNPYFFQRDNGGNGEKRS